MECVDGEAARRLWTGEAILGQAPPPSWLLGLRNSQIGADLLGQLV
jgi:hypothetical protein